MLLNRAILSYNIKHECKNENKIIVSTWTWTKTIRLLKSNLQ